LEIFVGEKVLKQLLDVKPFTVFDLLLYKIVPFGQCVSVIESNVDSSGFFMRLIVDCFKDKYELVLDFGFSQKVVPQIVSFNFTILAIFDHDLMHGSVNSDVLLFPDFKVETSALAYAVKGIGRELREGRGAFESLGEILQMCDDANVEEDFFFAIGLLKCVSEMDADLFFSFFELVQLVVILIELSMHGPFGVIEPNIEFLRRL
jgi:hypothetical protein